MLVVDDDAVFRRRLVDDLRQVGYETVEAASGTAALRRIRRCHPEAVVTDLKMPGMDGVTFIGELRASNPNLPVIVATGFASVHRAVAAMNAGACDLFTKPVQFERLRATVDQAVEASRGAARDEHAKSAQAHGLVANSPVMHKLLEAARNVASSHATVLLTGESGTGKSRLARYIHDVGLAAKRPFVELHCASVPESLIESELFGHERGAFTGAQQQRAGRFELAQGGTLFLDEIAEVSPAIQVKLLRVLQEHCFERVGGEEVLNSDARIIAATNGDLPAAVADGHFREDLYYRINVVHIEVPPLCRRGDDVVELAKHFVREYTRDTGVSVTLSDDACQAILDHDWPGNVRELSNAIERAVVMCKGETIRASDLSHVGAAKSGRRLRIPGASWAEIERYAILSALDACDGSTGAAADMLQIGARTIQYRLRSYGLARPWGGRRAPARFTSGPMGIRGTRTCR